MPACAGVLGYGPAADHLGSIHLPDRSLSVRVLPQDVRVAIVIEIAGSNRAPACARIGADGPAADDAAAVGFPDGCLPVRVLQKDVRQTIGVEIASIEGVPAWAGVGHGPAAVAKVSNGGGVRAIHAPQGDLSVAVLPEDVGISVDNARADG